ncbi:large conductance mechanosensitive channel protein MscL [Actinokineospora pegani]|uniref:large conductance mechanosensitive channel protein MscL n=1 Tax=Actinokineospora pegani TaxID=2654637 RepID=UPI0012E9A9A9|nr:large conductance mechanosensitive channel protein MscL [Actinokineospora pegani]
MSVLKGFKDFLMRGNVVELSIAVIIGTAFTDVVTTVTSNLMQPLINSVGGTHFADGLGFKIITSNDKTFLDFAAVINAVINFVLVAAVVYFLIVTPMKRLQERRRRGEEPGPAQPTDVELLTEIRDLLRQQTATAPGAQTTQLPPLRRETE